MIFSRFHLKIEAVFYFLMSAVSIFFLLFLVYYIIISENFGGFSMLRNLKQWFRDIDIRNKIIIFFVPLIIIPLLIVNFIFNTVFKDKLIDRKISSIQDNSGLIITRIEGILKNCTSCSGILTISISNIILQANSYGNLDYLYSNNKIASEISKAQVIFPEVDSVAFVDTKGRLYSNDAQILSSKLDSTFTRMETAINSTNGVNLYFPMDVRENLVTDQQAPTLTIGKKIIDIYTGDNLGSLFLNIKEKTFSSIFKNLESNNDSIYIIVDENNRIISSSDEKILLTKLTDEKILKLMATSDSFSTIKDYNSENMLITGVSFASNAWKLITLTPMAAITRDSRNITSLITLISVLCFVFVLIGSSVLSRVISKPIELLKNEMLKVNEDNLDVNINIYSKDEIGSLSRSFLKMLVRVKDLIEKVNLEQKLKREYELALISSQVKPHFLYNTLDTIYVLNEMDRKEDVQKTTKALADFYRSMLSQGRDIITLKEELNSLKNYLLIQNIRYSDVFDFEIQGDETLDNYKIPKFTLQPIVENAIYHGLKMKRDFGHLRIKTIGYENSYEIIISDDGVGMSEDTLSKILTPSASTDKNSFGLFSVIERLRIYYSGACSISIDSTPMAGTTVRIHLPKT